MPVEWLSRWREREYPLRPHGRPERVHAVGRIPSKSLASSADDQRERLRDAYRSESSQSQPAEPDNREARALTADALEQLGYQAESATWRNAYLYAAQELRHGLAALPPRPPMSPDMLSALTTDLFFDLMATRLDAGRAARQRARINWRLIDTGESVVLDLDHATLTHRMGRAAPDADASVTTSRAVLDALALGRTSIREAVASGALAVEGDAAKLAALMGMLDRFEMMFDVVTPGEGRP